MKHLKIRKLDIAGAAHVVALMAVIVLVGIGGSYYLFVSHADSCTGTSDPTSSPMSDPTSDPGCPTSGPTSGPVAYSASCTVAMTPSKPVGSSVFPVVTLKNTGTYPLTNMVSSRLKYVAPDGTETQIAHVKVASVRPGGVQSFKLGSIQVGNTAGTGKLNVKFIGNNNVSTICNKAITVTPS